MKKKNLGINIELFLLFTKLFYSNILQKSNKNAKFNYFRQKNGLF